MKKKYILFVFFCLVGFLNINCQKYNLNDTIPTDPSIRIGRLKNGMKYYIKLNKQPAKRVELRLAVNAGSLQESDNQQGLAHFTEHMCFNGTKNFEKNELINFLEKMGIKFGAELNAYTGFEETVYMLTIPTDKPGLLDTGIMVLNEWAHNVAFNHEEIDKERGVIIEEWRLGLGANDRMLKKYLPVILQGSPYASRLPIGKKEIIESFPYDTLIKFYNDWYRPELMALIVVGDIDVDEIENKIITNFSELKNPANPVKKDTVIVPDNEKPIISIVSDPENTYSIVRVYIKHDRKKEVSVRDYRNSVLQNLYNSMINERFNELLKKPSSPFLYAASGFDNFIGRAKDCYFFYAVAKENEILNSLSKLIEENEKVRKFGFNQSELDRQKRELISNYEKALKEKNKTESSRFADEYIRNFLEDEPVPGIETEYALVKQFIDSITIEEINKLAIEWITDNNWVVLITAQENKNVKIPTNEEVLLTVNNSKNNEVTAYVDNYKEGDLITQNLIGNKILSKKQNKKLGITEIKLSNGVKIILKPNNYKNDEILMSAFSAGGNSVYHDSLIYEATYADEIINESGLGNFDAIALEKKLAGNTASLSSYISSLKEGFSGSSSPKDFETLLQMVYLYFTSPRKDTSAFETFITNIRNRSKSIKVDPNFNFYDTLIKTINSNNPRYFIFPTESQLNKINLGTVYSIFTDRFADASDFTFIFVGNFNVDSIIPSLQKYLGSLPSIKRKENWKNVDSEFPGGVTKVIVNKGIEPKSRVSLVMSGKFNPTIKNIMTFVLLNDILDIRLRESLREDKGGTYSVRVGRDISKYPNPKYTLNISFGCSPDNVDSLVNTIFAEMKKLQLNGPLAEDMQKVIETAIRQREVDEKTNKFWLTQLESYYFNNYPILKFDDFKKLITSIKADDIKETAKLIFNYNNYVEVVLLPETKK